MRPAFHFTPAAGWINDPHGFRHHDGEYHAFFQYLPGRTEWSPDIHWGHAKGPDLLSLGSLPVAIAPGDGDGGIWTGSLVVDSTTEAAARIFYTSTTSRTTTDGRIRVATPEAPTGCRGRKGRVRRRHPRRHGALPRPVGVPRRRRLEHGAQRSPPGRLGGAGLVPLGRPGRLDVSAAAALRPRRMAAAFRRRRTPCGSARSCSRLDGRHVLVLSGEDEGGRGTSATPSGGGPTAGSTPGSWGRLSFSRSPTRPRSSAMQRTARRSSSGSTEIRGTGLGGCAEHPVPAGTRGRRTGPGAASGSRALPLAPSRGRMSRARRPTSCGPRAPARSFDRRRRRRARRAADDRRRLLDRDRGAVVGPAGRWRCADRRGRSDPRGRRPSAACTACRSRHPLVSRSSAMPTLSSHTRWSAPSRARATRA